LGRKEKKEKGTTIIWIYPEPFQPTFSISPLNYYQIKGKQAVLISNINQKRRKRIIRS
jgi:hypothetical protein